MASPSVQNPPTQTESKSARKKKAAKAARPESPAPAATSTPEKAASVTANDNQDDFSDNVYIRELHKCVPPICTPSSKLNNFLTLSALRSIRAVNKKLTNASKIDHLVAEHGAKTLDELVSSKIINADQKAAYLKKPSLQAQLSQFEEQLAQHKKIEQENRTRLAEQKKALTEQFEKERAELVAEFKEKAEADAKAALKANFLILSQFLRLAAARRMEEPPNPSDESAALEGVLLHVYSGDEDAVSTMLKLVEGVDEQTRNTSDQVLQTTYATVKQLSIQHAYPEIAVQPESETEVKDEVQSDPTVVNASLTEIEEGSAEPLTNGRAQEATSVPSIPSTDVADSAANAAGESQPETSQDMTMSQEWVDVKVPRDPSETETGLDATPAAPAAPANAQSWADDHPEPTEAPATAPADSNDGFHQVQRNRGGNREGGYRGGRGGERGGYRGRGGFRGDGRGRGRGGQRGGQRGVPSRPRGADEQQ
ncbi:hypothetical protein B0H66DRAFT_318179 [Apodospora peruviana]|uniref:YAG7-like dimerisation domain-containing protein n=1 Tax=Apodospora peruviana TaxID=516989 RepID=A0AAE0HXH6_9PEZI|nr:hypothetical protein B0H66DRAFT_318179 [Apodospora peruviana]